MVSTLSYGYLSTQTLLRPSPEHAAKEIETVVAKVNANQKFPVQALLTLIPSIHDMSKLSAFIDSMTRLGYESVHEDYGVLPASFGDPVATKQGALLLTLKQHRIHGQIGLPNHANDHGNKVLLHHSRLLLALARSHPNEGHGSGNLRKSPMAMD